MAEDHEQLRALACKTLRRQGYTVLDAQDGKTALELAAAHAETIHLLVTDTIMPDIDGRSLYQHLSAARPGIRALFMSGYPEDIIGHHGVLDPGVHFIQKPFSFLAFSHKVRAVLDQE